MPRLRMKPTSTDEAILAAQRRASRKSRKHRPRSESLSPPRHRPPASAVPPNPHYDFDESSVPPEQAYKRTRTDDEFYEALQDAQLADEGAGFHEANLYERQVPAYATSYGSAAGAAAGIDAGRNHLGGMDDDEYAEFVRAGMWRLKNRDEVERLERVEKERKAREERERRENLERDRKERERIRRLEEKRKRRNVEFEQQARERYEQAWQRLQRPTTTATTTTATRTPDETTATPATPKPSTSVPLQFTDFAWPIFPAVAFPPLSWPVVTDLTTASISTFLLPSTLSPDERKVKLRAAVLSYHPDKFERLIVKIPEDKDDVRERVRELGLRASQVLNEMMKSEKASAAS
ncbi:hypothetical protein JCM10212_005263 [Sporobolomyces blumeae]